jgi:hypothetical protein
MGDVVSLEGRLNIVRTPVEVDIEYLRHEDRMRVAAARAHTSRQRAKRTQRVAPWADKDAIRGFYEKAVTLTRETGIEHEVDHIIPLLGKLVSGLHVENNLRVIPKDVNRLKSNRFMVGDAGVEPATFRV